MNSDQPALEALLQTSTLPALGPDRRAEAVPLKDLERGISEALGPAKTSPDTAAKIRSAVLLWHDHLDASHRLSQDIGDATGSFLHGIMHRREPDYGNAKYWFHRVGNHPTFQDLARRVAERLDAAGENALKQRLLPGGNWDPFAFVDFVAESARGPKPRQELARELQALEFQVLWQAILNGA